MNSFFNGAGGGIISSAMNFLGGLVNSNIQQNNTKELMGLQAKYNKEAAQYNQQLAKDMWTYTNYPNQVKQMREAGLSPALLYGQAGAGGGSTAGAGQAAGVNSHQGAAPNTDLMNSFMSGLLMKAQKENIEADTKQKQTQAGVNDSLVDLNKALAEMNKSLKELQNQQREVAKAQIPLIQAQTEEAYQKGYEAFMSGVNQNLSAQEIEARLNKFNETWAMDMTVKASIIKLNNNQAALNEEQKKLIIEQTKEAAQKAIKEKIEADNWETYFYNIGAKLAKEVEILESEATRKWVETFVHAGMDALEGYLQYKEWEKTGKRTTVRGFR